MEQSHLRQEGSLAAINGDVYFSNPDSTQGRINLSIRKSSDGGHTWPSALLIQKGKSAGYSSLLQSGLPDGKTGAILYEDTKEGNIVFRTFDLDFDKAAVTSELVI